MSIIAIKSRNIFVKKYCKCKKYVLLCVCKFSKRTKEKNIMQTNNCFVRGDELYEKLAKLSTNNIEALTGELLMCLGFKFKLTGTTFLKAAILFVYNNGDHRRIVRYNAVYKEIANQFDTNSPSVERNIRTAVSVCTEHGNLVALNDLLHNNLVQKDFPPSNCDLISGIATWLRLLQQKELSN